MTLGINLAFASHVSACQAMNFCMVQDKPEVPSDAERRPSGSSGGRQILIARKER